MADDIQAVDPEEVLPAELENALKSIILSVDRGDEFARDRQIRIWRRNEHFWEGLQKMWWSEVAHDYRPLGTEDGADDYDIDDLDSKVVNIYRAHGEAIIAAVSQSLPSTRFYPQDADNPNDIFTAQSFSKLAQLIRRHNKAPFLFMKALGLLYNHGIIAAYTYNDRSEEYGVDQVPRYAEGVETNSTSYCPECGEELAVQPVNSEIADPSLQGPQVDPALEGLPNQSMPLPPEVEPMLEPEELGAGQQPIPEEMPEEDPLAELPIDQGLEAPIDEMTEPTTVCPQCGSNVVPMVEETQTPTVEEVGYEAIPKCKQIIELYGGLHVQLAPKARTLKQSGYLILNDEHDIAEMQDKFPHIAEKITPTADSERYDRWARTPSVYAGDEITDTCTVRQVWLRSWMFNKIGVQDERVAELKTLYPSGCRAIFVNDILAEIIDEDIDKHWTVSQNPINDRMHGDPFANPIVPIQEMTNEMFELTIETIRYGIPETFVDSQLLDFTKYRDREVGPGMLYPVKAPAGNTIGSAFYTNKSANLSREHKEFSNDLNNMGQFVLGSFPSIYGGTMEGGSGTAAEYSMSRSQALQRLQLVYKMLSYFWAELEGKAVQDYADNMKTDEHIVQKMGSNSYINIWVRRAEMEGKVGQIEPEVSEQFPLSWAQKRDVIMRLLELQNDALNEAMFHPENRYLLAELIGVPEFTVPGNADRSKQLYEILELLQAEPMMMGMDPMTGQPLLQPSIPIDPDTDDDDVHIATLKAWCVSEIGMDQKATNPAGYMNVTAHLKMHLEKAREEAMQQMMAQAATDQKEDVDKGKGSPPKNNKEPDIPQPKGVANA